MLANLNSLYSTNASVTHARLLLTDFGLTPNLVGSLRSQLESFILSSHPDTRPRLVPSRPSNWQDLLQAYRTAGHKLLASFQSVLFSICDRSSERAGFARVCFIL